MLVGSAVKVVGSVIVSPTTVMRVNMLRSTIICLAIIGIGLLSDFGTLARPHANHLYYNVNSSIVNGDSNESPSHVSIYYKPTKQYHAHVAEPLTPLGRMTPEAYNSVRDMFFRYEESKGFGADLKLNKRELQANEIIMAAKMSEYDEGLQSPHLFKPSQHIFSVLEKIRSSELFGYLSDMPKGAVLHAHDTALCSTEFIIKLTYRADLWACEEKGSAELIALRFSKQRPTLTLETECTWELLSQIRQTRGPEAVDKYLSESLSLYPTEHFLDNSVAWQRFMKIFGLLDGLVTYAPVWSDYYYNALEEFQADGVQYLEFRTTLPLLYDMDGGLYKQIDTVRVYVETLQKFQKANPDFIGSRMIFAPSRNTDEATVEQYIRTCVEIQAKYPDFVAGFDLVGQEELGRPLREFLPQILSMPDGIDFFFHAGETNWGGTSVDENLVDAILLGTKRIGHGFAIVKHPLVMELVKARNVAIEVNPVSNQVLQLVSDLRNHPAAMLFADNYPVIVSSDDPSFWKASPLSHDFYMAFLGIASAHSDLRFLKKLAINSIQYSSLSDVQKANALIKWQVEWDSYIERVITGENNSASKRFQAQPLA